MHYMIDLETLGLSVEAPILQIGAVAFDPQGRLGDTFQRDVYLEDALAYGKVEAGTLRWWMQQETPRQRLLKGQERAVSLREALSSLRVFLPENLEGIWSHGAAFDLPVLARAYARLGRPTPWDFHSVRDTRTLLWAAGSDRSEISSQHDALEDAKAQALAVIAAYAGLQTKNLPQNAPQAYATSHGVVMIPKPIREHLGLLEGGDVFFLKGEQEQAFLLSERAYLQSLETEK